jgi:hypothetical protein
LSSFVQLFKPHPPDPLGLSHMSMVALPEDAS